MAGEMHKNVVQRRALNGERGDRDIRLAGRVQQSNRRARAVVGRNAEHVIGAFDLRHLGELAQPVAPVFRRAGKADFENVPAGNGSFEFQRRIEQAAFTVGGGLFRAPAQRLVDFLAGRTSVSLPESIR